MDTLLPSTAMTALKEFATIVKEDKHAELECKLLSNQINTKDVADRIVKTIQMYARGAPTDAHHATFSYSDGLRVVVIGAENIHKVCTTGSFRGVPLDVERKRRYFEVVTALKDKKDTIDVPDAGVRITLRHEEHLRKDFSGAPMDSASFVRIIHRKSWTSIDGIVRFDFSLTKSKTKLTKTFAEILKQNPTYELELEVVDTKKSVDEIVASIVRHVAPIIAAFQGSQFVLTASNMQRYLSEFETTGTPFLNPVTLERRHLVSDRPANILKGYTVTNKADGERCFLVVMRDRRLLRITPSSVVTWTGLTANKEVHVGDIIDGEYLSERNQFYIFDMYWYRNRDVRRLPLFVNEDDMTKSRLGAARSFVAEIPRDFTSLPGSKPLRISTKIFLSGDGEAMQEAIRKMLDTKFEYPIDGLVFTPRSSPVGPMNERRGKTWLTVYKWKPSSHNSIDFLVKFKAGESFDMALGKRVVKGTLYVSRTPGDIVYPCETMTGEYVPPEVGIEQRVKASVNNRIPSPFQPMVPRAPDAHIINLPLNDRGVPVDADGNRVEDDTIIECSYDTENGRWIIMRTRHDKTHQYRVLRRPQFGNDIAVADSIWTNIHVPITEEMIRNVIDSPPDATFEDDLYYRDNLDARDRILKDVYSFHNRIKDDLYRQCIKRGDSLLELAVGRAGDLLKWKRTKPSLVVGVDSSQSCLTSPRQGACVRYLKEKANHPTEYLPPVLFICGDMTKPLFEGTNKYASIVTGSEPATTPYLETFAGQTEFDVVSCQMAIHYACESDETFETFATNLETHGKGLFFGTCLDGAAVYSLLLGKQSHLFRSGPQVFGEFVKEYDDGTGWSETFGNAVSVHLESFEQPQKEYLVPFDKMVEVLKKHGYNLVGSTMFNDHYGEQNNTVLSQEHQAFSFLHRSFVFEKGEVVKEKKQEVEIPVADDLDDKLEKAKEAWDEAFENSKKSNAAPGYVTEEEVEKLKAKFEEIRDKIRAKREQKDTRSEQESPAAPEPKKRAKKISTARIEGGGEKPVLFFGADEGKGEWRALSNMYEAPFQVDSITFPTVEHYFQWSKAKKFGDGFIADKILKTPSPKAVKALGKKVKDFDKDAWDKVKDGVMRTGVKAKFMQHPDLKTKLMETGVKPIGEASARDKYWGIGTSADTSKANDPTKWPGKNVLGKMLADLRKELKE
jgi:ribA/ribD-fused uncharacterized protein